VLRRAFMTSGPAAALAAVPLGITAPAPAHAHAHPHLGEPEADALEQAVHRIRLLDDRHGADSLYAHAGESLHAAYEFLDTGTARRHAIAERLHRGTGELAISVGWLAHDSGRFGAARSHYAEALATARVAADPALEAHAFCNTAFLARDSGRPREAVRAAQAGQQAARHLGSARLLSLLALREAGGWAGLGDRRGCQEALTRAQALFSRGPSDADPAWMSFFGEAELVGLEAQCWSALREWERAAEGSRRAVALRDPHFARNKALFTAELAGNLAATNRPDEAADAGTSALGLLGPVQSSRIRAMLSATARRLRPHARDHAVAAFLDQEACAARQFGGRVRA
jgi:tetratricopeptide (TPR) repeat protein